MRSSSLAWLLETAGFHCSLLAGGYKSFRRWTQEQFKKEYPFIVMGGLTGSGKTDLLQLLKSQNEQVVDLEDIAQHRGSSFGHLGYAHQPSQEQFENLLATQLATCNSQSLVWIEDESRMIGTCFIPKDIWEQLSRAFLLWVQSPKEQRVKRLLAAYGSYAQEDIVLATQRIVKKLGAVRTKEIVQSIQNGEMEIAITMIIDYYDRAYVHSCQKRQRRLAEFGMHGSDQECVERLKKISCELIFAQI
jgi:tRNA 2-selenouridine synthase